MSLFVTCHSLILLNLIPSFYFVQHLHFPDSLTSFCSFCYVSISQLVRYQSLILLNLIPYPPQVHVCEISHPEFNRQNVLTFSRFRFLILNNFHTLPYPPLRNKNRYYYIRHPDFERFLILIFLAFSS